MSPFVAMREALNKGYEVVTLTGNVGYFFLDNPGFLSGPTWTLHT